MDAVKFLKEKRRMCEDTSECNQCPLYPLLADKPCYEETLCKYAQETVFIVEQWSKEHPVMTNEQKFREVFGETHSLVKAPSEWWVAEYKETKGET